MSEKKINVADFIERSTVNGHGTRAVLWVQGCHFHCPGCFNPDNQSYTKKNLVPVSEMANRILMIEGIEGVTFSGGEPFNQAAALSELAAILKEHGLTVMIFTGYDYSDLLKGNRTSWNALISHADMLITGRYEKDKATDGKIPLLGSSNQEVISLTGNIPAPDLDMPIFEVKFTPNGMYVTGFPPKELIEHLKASVR